MLMDRARKQELAEKLQRYGIKTPVLEQLSLKELEELLRAVENISPGPEQKKKAVEHKKLAFSTTDKKILKALLSSSGSTSSLMLSKSLDIPLSTVQRRRKKLESDFLEFYYLPKVEKLGWHIALVFITMDSGTATAVGKELLSWEDSVVRVARTMGGETIDLIVEVVYRDNKELLDICDSIKAIAGVRNIFWTELVAIIGKNTACFESMIDSM